MKKRLLTTLLALCLLLSLLPMTALAESSYTDTGGHWAEEAIERWSGYGVIQGNNGSFRPNGSLTRAHMAAILCRLLALPEAESAGFSDVREDDWHADYINRCAAAGILLGNDGKASPDAPITRQQAIVMLGRALGIRPVEDPDLSRFRDGAAVSDYARGYVAAMTEAGIVGGVTADTLEGGSHITRAATVTILHRAVTSYVNEAGAVVAGTGDGIVLVVADNVTVSGSVESLVVAGEDNTVTVTGGTVESVAVVGPQDRVVLTGNSQAADVTVPAAAEGASVVVHSGAQVERVTVEADNVTVSGSGTVESVITSGDNTAVNTDGTDLTVAEGATGVSENGKAVAGGSTVETEPAPSAPVVPVHYHSYTYTDNKDGTHSGTCACGATTSAAHVVGDDGTCSVCGASGFVARIGTVGYTTLEDALAVGGEITLLKDIYIVPQGTGDALIPQMSVTKDTVLNLNGKTLGVDTSIFSEELTYTPAIMEVTHGATLTINGEGTITAEAGNNNSYGIDIKGGNAIINGGNYYGALTALQVEAGSLVINGGFFDMAPTCKAAVPQYAKYVVNCIDSAYKDGSATIEIKGGTFVNFNPSANPEGTGTSYVATGYTVQSETTEGNEARYTVVQGTAASTDGEQDAASSDEAATTAE